MKKRLILFTIIILLVSACKANTQETPEPPSNQKNPGEDVPTPQSPTDTPIPEPTATQVPQPTPTRDPMNLSFGVGAYELANLKAGGPSNGLAWHPESTLLAMSGVSTILIWEMRGLTHEFILEGHSDVIIDLAWSPDGESLASLSLDEIMLLWPAPDYISPAVIESGQATSFDWAPSGDMLVVGLVTGELQIWHTDPVELLKKFSLETLALITDVDWSPDGSKIAVGDGTGTLTIWDTNKQIIQVISENEITPLTSLAWSPDGNYISTGYGNGLVHIRNSQTWETLHTIEAIKEGVTTITWSPDSLILAAGGYGKSVGTWDIASGTRLTGAGVDTNVTCVLWSPNGNILAVGAGARRRELNASGTMGGGWDFDTQDDFWETVMFDISPNPEAGLVYLWMRDQ